MSIHGWYCVKPETAAMVAPAVVNFSVHILLIDDDAELCLLLGEFLQREGFTVDCEHEGNRGLEKARGDGVDLVVLDVMLPGIDGFEILRRLRQESKVPVMMLTARPTRQSTPPSRIPAPAPNYTSRKRGRSDGDEAIFRQ